jgi:glycosyltransferase involved in cell wall biosynthesis
VLDQSACDLELIIVDDGSTDGTAAQIKQLMDADARVSCLRHSVNIGLPAVSEYEALRRARGDYLAFGFDDFIFEADALGRLLQAAIGHKGAVVHGYAEFPDSQGRMNVLGRAPVWIENLATGNFIANASFVVPRSIVDDIGFYDPHIVSARLCDWDLWRRIVRDYPLFSEDILVGRELGLTLKGSLGSTYPLHYEACQEYFGRRRNERLRPEQFEDFDVWEVPPDCSSFLAEFVLWCRGFFQERSWANGLHLASESDRRTVFYQTKRTLGIIGNVEASMALCFDGLMDRFSENFLFLQPLFDDYTLQLHLARCDAVVVVRDLLGDDGRRTIAACEWMNIPLYYLVDDNFIVIGDEFPEYQAYTVETVAEVLRGFAGVLCASPALSDYFRDRRLHSSIDQVGAVFDAAKFAKVRRLRPAPTENALRVGFVGGLFRLRSLNVDVVPALARSCVDGPIELLSRTAPDDADTLPFEVKIIPFEMSFDAFLLRWRLTGIDVIAHPRGVTRNLPYKCKGVLIGALYLGAVPVVADEPAFEGLGEEQGDIRIGENPGEWERAFRRLRDAEFRHTMLDRLEAYCRHACSGESTVRAIEKIFADTSPTDLLTWSHRMRQLPARRVFETIDLQDRINLGDAQAARLKSEAFEQAETAARLQSEADERDAQVARLEGQVLALEREVKSRAYALALKFRKAAHFGRRALSRLRGSR